MTLLERIVADLKQRRDRSPDNGLALADWLAKSGTIPFVGNFDDALASLAEASEEDQQRLARGLFTLESDT
jgi:hypothetical protein